LVQSGRAAEGGLPGEALASIGAGAAVGVVGAAVLWLLLREVMRDAPTMVVPTMLTVVVAAVVAADLIRDDAGFMAATLMGIALGNQGLIEPSRRVDLSIALRFQETLVQLLVGVLFVLIAASVSTGEVQAVLPEALVLVAVMALLIRPVAVLLATLRSRFTWRERAFVAWMAPRGIVAGATASAFGLQLAQEGSAGAEDVLPIVFVAIFGTVALYGLTAPLAARALGLAGKERGLVLVVGGQPWARELAVALKRSGVAVRMWVGPASDRAAALDAGLDADRGRMMVGALDREAELEEITDALLLTRSDDFKCRRGRRPARRSRQWTRFSSRPRSGGGRPAAAVDRVRDPGKRRADVRGAHENGSRPARDSSTGVQTRTFPRSIQGGRCRSSSSGPTGA
jgi:hypothetical protein